MNIRHLSRAADMRRWLLPLLLLLMGLCACARQPQPGTLAEQADAARVWERYLAVCDAANAPLAQKPYRLQMSLRYGTEGDTRRVTALLWGNGDDSLRLDVAAGVGVTVASILEDGEQFMVYAPNDHRAYFHYGAQKPLVNVGVPVPFGVGDLAALLNGRFGAVFGTQRDGQPRSTLKGNIVYAVEGGHTPGSLELDAQGLPLLWRDADGSKGWTLTIAYDDNTPPLPRKLEITHAKGQRAIVLVKERNYPAVPFTEEQLRLTIPEGTPVLPLRQFRQGQR